MHRSGHPGYDDDSQYPDDTPPRCGGTGMVAYWDGSAYAGEMCRGCDDCEEPDPMSMSIDDSPAPCTNCGESAKPHPAYADFVGPFCEGCWDKLREHFTSDAICHVCKHAHDRETSDCKHVLDLDLQTALAHLDAARQAIADAQQWADKWKAHAFKAKAQRDKLMVASEYAFAFIDSIEWNDDTSGTQAENTKHALQEAITAAEDE
jgi:hypothetical protein